MTYSAMNNPTITNSDKATKHSSLEPKASPKNEFLKSFSSGKLRKNAKKKIQKLLDCADSLVLKTQSMGLDDCWNANDPIQFDKANFWTWFDKEYSNMVIFLTVRDGVLVKAEFCDCIYHFSNDIVMTFSQDEVQPEKPRVTFEQVTQALEQGYISPLNHDQKKPTPPEPTNTRKVVSLGDYQGRIEAKRERLEERAEKAQVQSEQHYQASKSRADMIPFGQPILVGHHSEARARRDAQRIWDDMGKSVAAQKKADYLTAKSESVGSAGIASDDQNAIEKLKEKLAGLERCQEMMKAINKVIRSKHMTDADRIEYMMQTHQLTEKQAKNLLVEDYFGRTGYASYQLSNNSAVIRSTKERIQELEALHNQAPLSEKGCVDGLNWTLFEEDGRIKFSFDVIPSEDIRSLLKSNGFKWSRYSQAWVRKLTANAVSTTRYVLEKLR